MAQSFETGDQVFKCFKVLGGGVLNLIQATIKGNKDCQA